MKNIRIDRKNEFEIKMPTFIQIGDPLYFEKHGENFELVYSRRFRGKKEWFGKLIVTESVNLNFSREFGREIPMVDFRATFAPTKEYLGTYEDNLYYKGQKVVTTQIGVDTAHYIIETNSGCVEIGTGSDGFMGEVNEFFRGPKLEGIIIHLTGLDVNSFERFRDKIKYVFGL